MADLKISQLTGATTPLAGTEVLPIVQSGSTRQVSVANLTAGRTQTSNGIVQGTAGTGYNFTANTPAAGMTSQLLNWYEEGTFTPTVAPSTSGTLTLSGSANTLTYTRIGRSVTVTGYLQFSAVSSPVGYISISLPVAIGASATKSSSGSLFVNNTVAAAMNAFVAVGLQGESVMRIYLGTGTSASDTSAQEMKSTSEIYLSFTYFA